MGNYKQASLVGTKNGTNKDFTIPFNFIGDALIINNNVPQEKVSSGAGEGEYTIVATVVTFGVAPQSTDTLIATALEG